MTAEEIIIERAHTHGCYKNTSRISQRIKESFESEGNWAALSDAQKESLQMIAVKIARILSGDRNNIDSWKDIAGYAKLVSDTLE